MHVALALALAACTSGKTETADTSPIGETGLDTDTDTDTAPPPYTPCAKFGEAVETVPMTGAVVVPDGIPRLYIRESKDWEWLDLDPQGEPSVTIFYDGDNAITTVVASKSSEEYLTCEERNTWEVCPDISTRGIETPDPWTYQLEVGRTVDELWLMAMPGAGAPGPCGFTAP